MMMIYVQPNSITASQQIHIALAEVTTKYVLFIDSSVEFTHNSNLQRMIALLESAQLAVVSPMTENAATNELSSNCFDVGDEG